MTAIITWDEGVISMAEPPIVSECSVSGVVTGSGLLLPVSPSHTMNGLNRFSRKMLGGNRVALSTETGEDIRRLIIFPGYMVKFKPFEPS